MAKNVNTKKYWEERFGSGSWSDSGRQQTIEYAKANVANMNHQSDFEGSILDFGCALGDAIPIYADAFPNADISGTDLSQTAIEQCKTKYGSKASFFSTEKPIENYDMIIASHVMEHLDDDINMVKTLLDKCKSLYVFVPYKESPLYFEHVNYYEDDYYNSLDVIEKSVFTVGYKKPMTFRSIVKSFLFLRPRIKSDFRKDIIMFHIRGKK